MVVALRDAGNLIRVADGLKPANDTRVETSVSDIIKANGEDTLTAYFAEHTNSLDSLVSAVSGSRRMVFPS